MSDKKKYMHEHIFEPWKNLVTLVSAIIVAETVVSFTDIKIAAESISEYNKAMDPGSLPIWISILVGLFVFRNIHGLLIIFNNPAYKKNVSESRVDVFIFYITSMLIVLTLSFCVRIDEIVLSADTLHKRAFFLLFFILFPSFIWIVMDINHLLFVFRDEKSEFVRDFVGNVFMWPFERTSIYECKPVWFTFGIITLVSIFLPYYIDFFTQNRFILINTVWLILLANLFIHTILDYCINSNYFMFGMSSSKTTRSDIKYWIIPANSGAYNTAREMLKQIQKSKIFCSKTKLKNKQISNNDRVIFYCSKMGIIGSAIVSSKRKKISGPESPSIPCSVRKGNCIYLDNIVSYYDDPKPIPSSKARKLSFMGIGCSNRYVSWHPISIHQINKKDYTQLL